jgi:hypothetical protein
MAAWRVLLEDQGVVVAEVELAWRVEQVRESP